MKGVAPPPVGRGRGAGQDRRRVALSRDHARVGLDLGALLLVQRLLHTVTTV